MGGGGGGGGGGTSLSSLHAIKVMQSIVIRNQRVVILVSFILMNS